MTAGFARSLDVTRGTTRLRGGGWRAAGCLALLSLLLLLMPSIGLRRAMAEDAAKPGAWAVAELAGTASTRAASDIDGAWQPLRVGTALAPGSVVMTGADSRLVLFNGVDRIRMSADSQLEITAAPETGITRVIHWIGSAFFQVGKRPSWQFEVDTPYLVAIVKGTKFTTAVGPAGASVKVREGIVGVSPAKGGDEIDVTAGQTASVSAAASGRVSRGDLSSAGDPAKTPTDGATAAGTASDQRGGGVSDSAGNGDSNQSGGDVGDAHGQGASGDGGNGDGDGHHHDPHCDRHGHCHCGGDHDHGHHGHGHGIQHAFQLFDPSPALRLADRGPAGESDAA